MSDDPRDFPRVCTRDGYSRYAYSWEIDAMEEEERLRLLEEDDAEG